MTEEILQILSKRQKSKHKKGQYHYKAIKTNNINNKLKEGKGRMTEKNCEELEKMI